MLFNGGVITKAESVDNGKTVSDFTDEEIAKKNLYKNKFFQS